MRLLSKTWLCAQRVGYFTHKARRPLLSYVTSILSSTLQDGAAGDDCLSSVAATDDGGVVVGGYSNGTYNGVASEGLVDFAAIKLGASVKRPCFFRDDAFRPPRARPERRQYEYNQHFYGQLPHVLPVCSTSRHPLSHPRRPVIPSLGCNRHGWDYGMDLAGRNCRGRLH